MRSSKVVPVPECRLARLPSSEPGPPDSDITHTVSVGERPARYEALRETWDGCIRAALKP
jgi:hypothetical protein